MISAGGVIDMVNKLINPSVSYISYQCDTSGVLSIKAFDRELVRYFSANGEIWVFFNVPNENRFRYIVIKPRLFNSFLLYRALHNATYKERETHRVNETNILLYKQQKFDGALKEE